MRSFSRYCCYPTLSCNRFAADVFNAFLQNTAVLSYRPNHQERPISCSLQSLEVFSCSLAAENETALSIIDPMIVTIELNGSPMMQQRTHGGPAGLADATGHEDKPPVVEVAILWLFLHENSLIIVSLFLQISFSSLNVRLSYNDMQLFLAIMHSMPNQLLQASQQSEIPKNASYSSLTPESPTPCYPGMGSLNQVVINQLIFLLCISDWQVQRLVDLGFEREDCLKALRASSGQLDEAALWLTQNATPRSLSSPVQKSPLMQQEQPKKGLQVSGFEVRATLYLPPLLPSVHL